MHLADLPGDDHHRVMERLGHDHEGIGEAVWRFQGNEGGGGCSSCPQPGPGCSRLPWKESEEVNVASIEPGSGYCRHHRRWPGQGEDGQTGIMGGGHNPTTGISDSRSARFTDDANRPGLCGFE